MISPKRRMAKRFAISRELERTVGIEPTTVTLARWSSTTELRPQVAGAIGRREGVAQPGSTRMSARGELRPLKTGRDLLPRPGMAATL